ncbi:tachykinin-like peptides receptor 99D [Hyalella azteca]|uniref:Tachykinin-like peptides receptor 99D n=1 Tax=Hyalella azteca TaxID=294128 RepID=A0A8B7PSF4_HYAAZ|nr:tachykinin-like peptides receptor 99D [Hyalella azteca]
MADFNMTKTWANITDPEMSVIVAEDFLMPWYTQFLWYLLFGSMVLMAVGGNLIVIYIVIVDRKMRSVTNIFIVNLSIADAMNAIFNVVFNFIFMLHMHWPFGYIYCKFNQFIAVLSICASIFTLMAVSFDRYWAIMYPLRTRIGRRATLLIVLCIWLASVALALPNAIFFTIAELNTSSSARTVCHFESPDAILDLEFIYNVLITVITYLVPMLCMAVTYTRMGLLLWGSQAVGEPTPGQRDTSRAKRKVVKMLIVVVVMFGVCWLPYQLYFIISHFFPYINGYEHMQTIYLLIYWLAMSNSMYNPIIYCWLNENFRNGFKSVFYRCLPCVPWLKPSLSLRPGNTMSTYYSTSGSPEFPRRFGHGRSIALHTLQNPSPASTITTRYDNGRSSTRSSSITNSMIHSSSSGVKSGMRSCTGGGIAHDLAYYPPSYGASRADRCQTQSLLHTKLSGDYGGLKDFKKSPPHEYSYVDVIKTLDFDNDSAKDAESKSNQISMGHENRSMNIPLSVSPLLQCPSSESSPFAIVMASPVDRDCPLVMVDASEDAYLKYLEEPIDQRSSHDHEGSDNVLE